MKRRREKVGTKRRGKEGILIMDRIGENERCEKKIRGKEKR